MIHWKFLELALFLENSPKYLLPTMMIIELKDFQKLSQCFVVVVDVDVDSDCDDDYDCEDAVVMTTKKHSGCGVEEMEFGRIF